jgi:hypothetical protein
MAARSLIEELPSMFLAPTSMTMASLVDHLQESKRSNIETPGTVEEYNTIYVTADELSAFMHEYSGELIAGLTTFYDCVPYAQSRRINNVRVKIKSPQVNILSGSTPSNLLRFVPEAAWEQGFTSRVIMVYSSDKPLIDIFGLNKRPKPKDLIEDLKIINTLRGPFRWTEAYGRAMHRFKEEMHDEDKPNRRPVPDHPKLKHYLSRRFSHLMKLSMIATIDSGNDLILTEEVFEKALAWMLEVEAYMPNIFKHGTGSNDSKALDEIYHFIYKAGPKGVKEHLVVQFALRHVEHTYSVIPMINLLERSGRIRAISVDLQTNSRVFVAVVTATIVPLVVKKE